MQVLYNGVHQCGASTVKPKCTQPTNIVRHTLRALFSPHPASADRRKEHWTRLAILLNVEVRGLRRTELTRGIHRIRECHVP